MRIFTAGLLIVLTFSCSSPEDPAELIVTAKSKILSGNSNTAIILLKNAIKLDPKSAEARFLLGQIYFKNNDFLSAEKEFNRAVTYGFNSPELTILMAKILLAKGNNLEVVKLLENNEYDNEDNIIRSNFILGKALLNLDQAEKSKIVFKQSLDINKEHPLSILGEIILDAHDNAEDTALTKLDSLLNISPELSEAWLLKGVLLSKQKSYLASAKAYEEYHKLNTNNFAIRTLIADNYLKANAYQLAESHLQALLQINDNHPTVNILLSQVKYITGDYKEAKILAEKALNVTKNGLAQMIYGLSSFKLKNYEQAYYQLNAIADDLPKTHDVQKVLAVLQVKLGYLDEVAGTIDDINNLSPADSSFFASVGIEYANKGDTESAISMFNKANSLAPNDPSILTQLAAIKLLNHDEVGGKNALSKAIELVSDFEAANIALAKLHLKNNDIAKAVNVAETWLAKSPSDITAMLLRGHIAMKENAPNIAKRFFNDVYKIEPMNQTALFNLAVVSREMGDYKQSNNYLDELFTINLEIPKAYRLAINNAMKLNNAESLEVKLNNIILKNPDAFWPRIILARRLNIQKNINSALDILNGVNNIANAPHEYFLTYVNLLIENGKKSELKALYEKWQLAQPENPRAYLTYVSILENEKAYEQALNVVKIGLSKDALKTNFQLQAYEAYYLIMTNQLEVASQKVNRLKAIKPNHPYLLRIQGQLELALNNFNDAAKYLNRSYLSNQKVSTGLLLVSAYKENNNSELAITFLTNELAKNENLDVYRRLLAELYIEKSPNLAIENYLKLIEKNPEDVISMNNLAWVYLKNQKVNLAEKYIKKATLYAPNHPLILDTYGIVLIKQLKIDKAIETLEKANKMMPKNVEIMKHLSEAYSLNGQKDLASALTNDS
ncbi:XrtA/PEP-CTERM system TPR-repeat protein PrsT [Thalassotalea castellviae]|uniref:PEP-CTERM system TPR-repeat protein PrsT n=1 Tax=Thalassotalea castellviae TaxID=3075612 RepID=A0ABU3A2L7_9GAMM|nr:XrtA/PEP-CTERM system TPR-repeat protein PrsT [Thalassotalea sp. W431]MDT0603797.1 PEP-CTERM system TPR-repeat protein PrsT [Thalassotalea sp. W431]